MTGTESEAGVGQGAGKFFAAEHAVAVLLGETTHTAEAYPRILEAIGASLGWQFGALWEDAPDTAGLLRCVEVWCAEEGLTEFAEASRGLMLPPGVGLPGRVWSTGRPAWITDVGTDANFPRAQAASATGLRSAFCFPIRSGRGLSGAIEFLTHDPREPDAELLATMETLASQIGQFVERGRAEDAVRAQEARHAGILDAALDCIVTIDDQGRVLEFNAAAERTFGYRSEDVVGLEMAELLVPPALRDEHRRGFARYLDTGDSQLLDQRIEIVGMGADGSEFPVELTITRIDLPGPPIFTGFIRDITERKRAEADLRASRVRLVEAQDAERRRLERNLHDGAQQRLVSLALTLRLVRERLSQPGAEVGELLDRAHEEVDLALAELRELARGIHPAVLTERGLEPAVKGAADRAPFPVRLTMTNGRLPEAVEAAAYYVVSEALANVAKYASASQAEVSVTQVDAKIIVEITDDGVGGADASKGSGLTGLADRLAALDGRLDVESRPAGGTKVRAEIPLA